MPRHARTGELQEKQILIGISRLSHSRRRVHVKTRYATQKAKNLLPENQSAPIPIR